MASPNRSPKGTSARRSGCSRPAQGPNWRTHSYCADAFGHSSNSSTLHHDAVQNRFGSASRHHACAQGTRPTPPSSNGRCTPGSAYRHGRGSYTTYTFFSFFSFFFASP